jgi:hypothetical protein
VASGWRRRHCSSTTAGSRSSSRWSSCSSWPALRSCSLVGWIARGSAASSPAAPWRSRSGRSHRPRSPSSACWPARSRLEGKRPDFERASWWGSASSGLPEPDGWPWSSRRRASSR